MSWGPVVGIFALFYTIIEAIALFLTETFIPEHEIDIARSFSSPLYNQDILEFGDHELYVDSKDTRQK